MGRAHLVAALLVLSGVVLGACVGDDAPATTPGPTIDRENDGGTSADGPIGPGNPAVLKLTPLTLRFPTTKPGTQGAPQKFTVTNAGGSPAPPLQSAGLQGTNTAPFAIATDDCGGKTLGAGQSCSVDVVFKPATVGEATANLLIGTLPAALSGFGGYWLDEDAKGASLNAVWGESLTSGGSTIATVYAVGNGGRVLVSTGNGVWKEEAGTTGGDLFAVHAVRATPTDASAGYVFATGAGPRLLRKKPATTSWETVTVLQTPPDQLSAGRSLWGTKDEYPQGEMYMFGTGTGLVHGGAEATPTFELANAPGIGNVYAAHIFDSGGNTVACTAGAAGKVAGVLVGMNAPRPVSAVQAAPVAITLRGVWADTQIAQRVVAVGDSGTIVRGNHCDSSGAFVAEPSNVDVQLNAIWASGPDLYAVGNGGTLLHSDTAGTWKKEESGTTRDLRGIFGVAGSDIYVVGDGIVLHKH